MGARPFADSPETLRLTRLVVDFLRSRTKTSLALLRSRGTMFVAVEAKAT